MAAIPTGDDFSGGLSSTQWVDLVKSVEAGRCVPFLGAGASLPLPLGSEMARLMSDSFGLIHGRDGDLARVAQYSSLLETRNIDEVRDFVKDTCAARAKDFPNGTRVHRVLAQLPMKFYITTNYDDLMERALVSAKKTPIHETCHWHRVGWDATDAEFKSRSAEARIDTPMVFHLHGSFEEPESMVLTEDDYLDFLTATTKHKWLIPPLVESALNHRLLFLGYSLEDITFRVVLRKLSNVVRRISTSHLTVQIKSLQQAASADDDEEVCRARTEQKLQIQQAAIKNLLGMRAQIYWGTCEQFTTALSHKWAARASAAEIL